MNTHEPLHGWGGPVSLYYHANSNLILKRSIDFIVLWKGKSIWGLYVFVKHVSNLDAGCIATGMPCPIKYLARTGISNYWATTGHPTLPAVGICQIQSTCFCHMAHTSSQLSQSYSIHTRIDHFAQFRQVPHVESLWKLSIRQAW